MNTDTGPWKIVQLVESFGLGKTVGFVHADLG